MGKKDPGRHDGSLFGLHESRLIDPAAEFDRLRASPPLKPHPVDDSGADYALQLAADVVDDLDRWEASDARTRATPETVRTAKTLRQSAEWLRTIAEKHGVPLADGLTMRVSQERVRALVELRAVFLVRAAGVENAVGSAKKRDENLPNRTRERIEIDPDQLRAEWERAKHLKPHADKVTLRATVAARLSKSEGTIKRRLKDHGIDPPRKLDK